MEAPVIPMMESIEYPMIEEPLAPIQPNYAAPQQMTEE